MNDARAALDSSFEQLYRGHHADVFRAALRELGNVHDAEDVTQAAFMNAYRAVLRGSRPEAPRAWLLAIAENVRRRRYRTAQRRPREEPIDGDFPLVAEVDHELAQMLAEALAALPPEQRRVFVLRELGGLSYEEIADETGSSVGAIQMLLFRARRSLRERLEPPVVGTRRKGLLLPLPGWLSALLSRAEVVALTPRAAGAIGATVAAVAATVAVNNVQADGAGRPVAQPAPPRVAKAPPASRTRAPVRVTRAVKATPARPAQRPVAATRVRTTVVRAPAPVAGAAASPEAPATDVPASEPTATPATPALSATETAASADASALEAPPLPVSTAAETVETVEAVLEPLPPVSTAAVAEVAAGAAGAAGAGAPPLPVPDVPPVVLPPAP